MKILLLIFVFRVLGICLGTMRIIYIQRNYKTEASLLGFLEMVVFCYSIGYTVIDMNLTKVFIYASGMYFGTFIGMWLDQKMRYKVLYKK